MPDEKLKLAMEEIKPILRKYDCAAVVFLQSGTHAEYLYHFSPSWSCVKLSEDGECRFKSKLVDYPDRETQHKVQEQSLGMLIGFSDLGRKLTENMDQIILLLGKSVQFSHRTTEER